MQATFFDTQQDFRAWLQVHHSTDTELLVGYYKVGSGKASMTWSESVDQALCFGWIDGVRRSIDEQSYCIRFTPRKSTSIWSAINIEKVRLLTEAGLMTEMGVEAFRLRSESRSKIYSHETSPAQLDIDYETRFKSHKDAWEFFTAQAPSYQRVLLHWIMSAKQEKTRLARLEKAIEASREQKRILRL